MTNNDVPVAGPVWTPVWTPVEHLAGFIKRATIHAKYESSGTSGLGEEDFLFMFSPL